MTWLWTGQGNNIAIGDVIYVVRYGLADRLTIDQIIKLEKPAEKYGDLNILIKCLRQK